MSTTGTPSVIATTTLQPASTASRMASAVKAARDEDHRGVDAFFFDGFEHRVEDGDAERGLAALAGRDAGDEFGAVVEAVFGVELADLAGDALADDARILID